MQYKRLRSSKNIDSLSVAKLSLAAKEQLSEAVYSQFFETTKIPAEFEEVSEGINNMGYLVLRTGHDFNEYCEIVSGSRKFSFEKTDICFFLSEISEKAESFLKTKDKIFIARIPKEKIFVNIDKEKFCFAILNIILNAAENTKSGGKIRLSVSKTKNFVKIIIGDNGFGMDEECVLHCFEPFYSKSSVHKKGKMGLGLTLARSFVVESKGRMNISSEKGKGTAVSMLLPFVKDGEANVSVESPVKDILGGKFSPVRIVFSALDAD